MVQTENWKVDNEDAASFSVQRTGSLEVQYGVRRHRGDGEDASAGFELVSRECVAEHVRMIIDATFRRRALRGAPDQLSDRKRADRPPCKPPEKCVARETCQPRKGRGADVRN